MFKSLNIQTGQDVVSIDPAWSHAKAIEILRSLGRQNYLSCPGCRNHVLLRAGEERRRHFAHKHLSDDCVYEDESSDLRNARAVLYEWLVSKYGDAVTIEKKLDDDMHRPVDCWVEKGSKIFAYWIFTSGMKPEERDWLKYVSFAQEKNVNWVFTSGMMKIDTENPRHLSLTTTERDFMKPSVYDELDGESYDADVRQSLHYLNADSRILTTYRNLLPFHKPQVYAGDKRTSSLSELMISPANGEFVHPGEHEQLMRRREELAAVEARQKEMGAGSREQPSYAHNKPIKPKPIVNLKEGTCIHCGKRTTDHWYYDGATGECECNDCKDLE
ncbi:MAG: hypothetical protein A2X48_12800 [Lentisphaerae bacterium GWF2_49_21]|nr:MAG: hypothetical protein A2X48_12800 [Lentisphaerae bacterium GWF2_49_21]